MPTTAASAAPAALLLHGAGGGGWEWSLWRPVFEAAAIRVDAPDLLPAAAGIADTRLEDYVAQATAALAALPSPRVLAGASLGGLVAAMVAARTDAAVDALVLVNPLPPAPWHRQLAARAWPDVVPWSRAARLASTRSALPDVDAAGTLFAFRRWRDESGGVLRQAYAGVRVESPRCPLLCIVSGDDADVPAATTRALARHWGGAVHAVEGASHVGPLLGSSAMQAARQALDWLHGELRPWPTRGDA